MRPDLFAGPALRDDRHRILARLAHGGNVPAPARHWVLWDPPQRARLAAVATLLATAAAAWVWLQNDGQAPVSAQASPVGAAPMQAPAAGGAARENAPPLAATIITAEATHSETAFEPPLPAASPASGVPAPRSSEAKPAHPRAAKIANSPRRQQDAASAPESDEDVTLLAAMLKHAKPQQPSPNPPKN
ncbi:hypothetical protein [Duganella sp. Root1480D1]|uniref:hypothetical protein n=1 Tax=Duganella sp. Root1480D1 TaxID=1736471 RepID=UPI00070D9963|nr:hypothetical protein [Duganella sp. Root1480D1]KQZ45107.1 hypothetical protein ASD58_02350 [Duganella sp. Root1480D1]